jgi:putative sterol carrier protein
MNSDLVKAHLNLYAVLVNLEDLAARDPEVKSMIKDWDVSMQFTVRNGPSTCVVFKNGRCEVKRGKYKKPSIKLYFFSPAHLNKMFDGKANPVLLKGFTKLGFLTKDFPKLTAKLEYYLKPTPELLKNKAYLDMNTRFTLYTAAFAVRELGMLDPVGKLNAAHIRNGTALLKVLPDGPAARVTFSDGDMNVQKGDAEKPMSMMLFKDLKAANDVLNQKLDGFTAIAGGEVMLRGQISMIDSMMMILDRVPVYLS